MSKAIRIHRNGGPEVMSFEDLDVPSPGPEDVVLRQTAIGVNFIDVYHRTGLYPTPLPVIPGLEGAGVVEAVGSAVTEFQPGDRVAYANPPLGAYAERRIMPADRLVRLPESIDDRTAAAMMLKGMTAHYLLRRTFPVGAGDHILVHAAAGGVGLILCQWAKHLGATTIGTVGSPEKAALARDHGCDHTIIYTAENFVDRVRDITSGQGVSVVYDSVGRTTFLPSLDCLRPMGMMVSFGQSSGVPDPIDIGLLAAKGSLFLTRPSLMAYTARRGDLVLAASELFDVVSRGKVRIAIGNTYPLAEAARAHRDLEARRTVGSSLLLP